ncbi:MAG: hypothetical protein ACLPSW_12825 [Roseiarcus sp.]
MTVKKPNGRPLGRPRKQIEPPPKRRRGRPEKNIISNPKRYLFAIIQANIDAARVYGISERRVVDHYAALIYGIPFQSKENIDALMHDELFKVIFDTSSYTLKGEKEYYAGANRGWYYQNAFRPFADELRGKLKKIRGLTPSHPDRRWLAAMSIGWRICLQGDLRAKDRAEALSGLIGESAYFQNTMRPILFRRFNEVTANPTSWGGIPEFMRILLPTLAESS